MPDVIAPLPLGGLRSPQTASESASLASSAIIIKGMDAADQKWEMSRELRTKLAIKDELFAHLVERITEEVREHERHLREQRGAPLVLHAHDSQLYTVENDRTGRQATIAFDDLQHIIEIRGEGIHYTFEVIISDKGSPSFTMRKDGELILGTVTQVKMSTAVHLAIDSITDLHAPI